MQGPPCTYTEELVEQILLGLEDGKGLRTICRELDVPRRTVRRWVTEDREGFAALYTRARDVGLDEMAEEVIEISDDGTRDYSGSFVDHDHIARSKLRVDSRKWYLSKIAPKRYGDRTEHVVETTHRFVLVAEVEQDQLTWQQQQNES